MCLQSLAALAPPPLETIVVADGDTDGSRHLVEGFDTRVIKLQNPVGPARARNLGTRDAGGDIFFFVDADVTLRPDSLNRISAAFRQDPKLSALFGSYDDEPSETNFLSQYKNLLHHYVHQTAGENAFTFWAACGAIRREVFAAADGFDERYHHPSIEDIELGYRLKRAGCRIRLLKEFKVKHLKHWNVLTLLKTDFFHRALPWSFLILEEGRFHDDLNLKISSRISVLCIYMLSGVLCAALYFPWLFVAAALLAMMLVGINRDLYRFFNNRKGLFFTLKAIPWHWFYFFYCGLAFQVAWVGYRIKKLKA